MPEIPTQTQERTSKISLKKIAKWIILAIVPAFTFPIFFNMTLGVLSLRTVDPNDSTAGFGAIVYILWALIASIIGYLIVGILLILILFKKRRKWAFGLLVLSILFGWWLVGGPFETPLMNFLSPLRG